jgi:predicted enzyme involved in methoxymalonyl-ACP biosynthesis
MRNFDIIDWTEKTRRLRYIGHIINLATQAFMFANDTEAAEIAYARAEISQLDNQLDNESLISMEATDNGLVKQPAL